MRIDLHTHGIGGIDTRSTKPEDYLRMAMSYKAHGTDAFVPTLFPGPVELMRAQLAAVAGAIELQGVRGLDDAGDADDATILGAHLEGPFVNPASCGALDAASFIEPSTENLMRLIGGYEHIVRIMTVAPELTGALGLIERLAGMNIRVNMGHSKATAEQARAGKAAGASGVTHLFNAMPGIHHREPGLAGFALSDDDMYVELIADFAHVHPDVVRIVARCKPAGRLILVSDSLGPAKTTGVPKSGPLYLPDGRTLAGSGISLLDAVKNVCSLGVAADMAEGFAGRNPLAYLKGKTA